MRIPLVVLISLGLSSLGHAETVPAPLSLAWALERAAAANPAIEADEAVRDAARSGSSNRTMPRCYRIQEIFTIPAARTPRYRFPLVERHLALP